MVSRTVRNTTPSGTYHLIHDLDGNVIAGADDDGDTLREYIWLEGRPVAVVADVPGTPTILQVHVDHIDRPIMMTDAGKAVVWRAIYLPYGEVFSITGSASLDYRFPGQWFQLESGLHYNWHRHYDPSVGRYLRPDPLGLEAGMLEASQQRIRAGASIAVDEGLTGRGLPNGLRAFSASLDGARFRRLPMRMTVFLCRFMLMPR